MKASHHRLLSKISYLLLVGWCGALLAGCGQVTVSQDYDVSFDFSANKTYSWDDGDRDTAGDLLRENDLLRKRFEHEISESLATKGYTGDANEPVLLIGCTYTIVTKLETEPYSSGVAIGMGRYGRYGGLGIGSGTYVNQYDQGRLTVNMYAKENGQLVWKGLATRQVVQHYTPQQYDALVHELVTEVMTQFPPAGE